MTVGWKQASSMPIFSLFLIGYIKAIIIQAVRFLEVSVWYVTLKILVGKVNIFHLINVGAGLIKSTIGSSARLDLFRFSWVCACVTLKLKISSGHLWADHIQLFFFFFLN